MSVQQINIGNIANDGTGDDLREAFIKVNQNFEELDLRSDEQTTASNLGDIGEQIFAQKIGFDLQFKKLVQGSNVTLTSTDNHVTIDATGGLQALGITSDIGSKILQDGENFEIFGGEGIQTTILNNRLTITNTGSALVDDESPALSTNLDAQDNDILNVNEINAHQFTGNLVGLVHGIDIREVENKLNNFDFGQINSQVTGIFDYIVQTTDIDFGFLSDAEFDKPTVDLGTL